MAAQTYYRLYCDYCGYNRVTNGEDNKGLVEYKRSPIQRGIPQYDPAKKQMATKDPIHLPKQFKCPGCGRLIRGKKMTEVNDASKSERDQAGTLGPQFPGKSSSYFESGRPEV